LAPGEWRCPASFGQERLWFGTLLEPGSPVYNISAPIPLSFPLATGDLVAALREVVRRHEILRTALRMEDGALVQVVHPEVAVEADLLDLSGVPAAERLDRLHELYAEQALTTIPLDQAPLWRACLVRESEAEWVLAFVAHHAILDASSVVRLTAELAELCRAAVEGRQPRLPDLPIQYGDYAVWQRRKLDAPSFEAGLAYWRERLAGLPGPLTLPLDRPRPASPSYGGADVRFPLSTGTRDRLAALARRLGSTPFTVLLATFVALLHRLSGQTDILVGVPVGVREPPQLEPLIGMFVNPVVVRADASGDPTFAGLVERVGATLREAWAHQDVPFQKIVEAVAPRREPGVPPLYQCALNYLTESTIERRYGTAREELLLELSDVDGRLEYRHDLFDPETARALADRYVRLLDAALSDPAARLSGLDLLDPAERELVTGRWNSTATPFPEQSTVLDLVWAQAERRPGAVAVRDGRAELTYGELRDRAGRLAHRLRALGAGPERLVGVALPRSADLVVAVLAVLEAGAAYVPLDPAYPPERLRLMLADSGAAVVVTSSVLRGRLPDEVPAVACVDEAPAGPPATACPPGGARPENLAYVIYTSGSTGRPKGVMVEHRSLVNFVAWFSRQFGLGPGDRVLASSSPSFDAFGVELYPPLASGGTVVMAPPSGFLSPDTLLETAAAEQVTMLSVVPTTLRVVAGHPALAACTSVRQVVCGGEALPGELAAQLAGRLPVPLHNLYGPTEATICISFHTAAAGDAAPGPLPIGRPVANARLSVLDGAGGLTPVGVAGHLHAAGVPLARGYLGRPGDTAAAFVPDPFGPPGSRLYRTGDRASWGRDGTLAWGGRLDQQVKLRGLRIEPGEIESVLRAQPGLRDAVVVLREDAPDDRRLAAYVVSGPGAQPAPAELRAALAGVLPDHMVPSTLMVLDRLPMTPNGKLDVRALPAPDQARAPARDHLPPRTTGEELVAGIWAEVLGVEQVGALDDFFELGGHSLLAMMAMAQLSEAVEHEIPIELVFSHPTVGGLAAAVERLLLADPGALPDDESRTPASGHAGGAG